MVYVSVRTRFLLTSLFIFVYRPNLPNWADDNPSLMRLGLASTSELHVVNVPGFRCIASCHLPVLEFWVYDFPSWVSNIDVNSRPTYGRSPVGRGSF
ncbi:hypothetical protein C8F04DRAFT_1127369 [Mycena alexandri]|uniref:Uncharacterized protein n=1 Tax=Mycena alexandri TaxID=1745969 RepID=A0AAD6WUX5_9AGAR|nr:hypothetical protein C8F04DRAFT_1127369 [Mycena alexandri]